MYSQNLLPIPNIVGKVGNPSITKKAILKYINYYEEICINDFVELLNMKRITIFDSLKELVKDNILETFEVKIKRGRPVVFYKRKKYNKFF